MSGASRKVKNPLLSAAGEGFPFENYVENTLLVPVTPATPAVLRDDVELDNFVGQGPVSSHNLTSPATSAGTDSEFTPIPLHSENTKSPENQSARQGYFTSILSSLPNLSLSSITGDLTGTQGNQGLENAARVQDTNPYVPSHDRYDSLRDAQSPLVPNFHDPGRTNFAGSGEVCSGTASSLSAPRQPTLPPIVPPSTDGHVSYRFGNQRRLKYAPPPDLTSSTSKQYTAPAVQPLFTPQTAVPPAIFNPNEFIVPLQTYQPVETPISTNSPSVPFSTSEELSQGNSLQESFRSSPVTVGTPRSVTPKSPNSGYESVPLNGKPGVLHSLSRAIPSQLLEPATPQNTPANISFAGFDLYANQQDFLTFNPEKESTGARNTPSQVDAQVSKANILVPTIEVKPSVSFTPISAVQVSEKLEHLLAEQEEDSLNTASDVPIKSDESTGGNQIIVTSEETTSNDTEKESNFSKLGSLSDVLLTQEDSVLLRSTVVAPKQPAADEEINAAKSHAVSSSVPSFQQYFQTQPFELSSSFLTDISRQQKSKQKSSLNYIPAEVPIQDSSSDQPQLFAQPASSFFSSSDDSNHFPTPQYKEISTNVGVVAATPKNDLHQSSSNDFFNLNYNNPPPTVSQPFWDTNSTIHTGIATATCSASVQSAPPPLLYNPTQFQNELHKPATSRQHPYISPFGQPTANQTQHYFDSFPGPTQTYDTPIASNNIFHPAPSVMTTVPEPTGSATLNPVQMSINPLGGRSTTDSLPPSFQNLAAGPSVKRMQCRTVYHHWFYRKEVEYKVLWLPFSMQDSLRLEEVHNSSEITPEATVATDGGRYDVDILRRQRSPVYWSGSSTEVRRCSWFFKGPTESRYVPYDESTAAKLEEEYKQAYGKVLENIIRDSNMFRDPNTLRDPTSVGIPMRFILLGSRPVMPESWNLLPPPRRPGYPHFIPQFLPHKHTLLLSV
ncbi:SEC23-interacting protein [Dufourea novaeangliae]|nr:SEC23-interacting protein [Dufourea novaeangliae]